jgi:hypothetical protein
MGDGSLVDVEGSLIMPGDEMNRCWKGSNAILESVDLAQR